MMRLQFGLRLRLLGRACHRRHSHKRQPPLAANANATAAAAADSRHRCGSRPPPPPRLPGLGQLRPLPTRAPRLAHRVGDRIQPEPERARGAHPSMDAESHTVDRLPHRNSVTSKVNGIDTRVRVLRYA